MNPPLAIRPEPGPDEALPGYLLRIARRNQLPGSALIKAIKGSKRPGHLLTLAPDEHRRACSILGLDAAQLTNMTIETPEIREQQARTGKAARGGELALVWGVRTRHSLACPTCLNADDNPGIWKRIWRLAIIIVCPIHETFLDRRCTRCGQTWFSHGADPAKTTPQRPFSLATVPPPANRCNAPRPNGWCGAPIERSQQATPSPHLIEATRHFLADWPFDNLQWHRRQAPFTARHYRPASETIDLTPKEIDTVTDALNRPWPLKPRHN